MDEAPTAWSASSQVVDCLQSLKLIGVAGAAQKKKINERGSNNSMYVRPLGGVVVGRIIAQGFASNRIDSLQCTHSAVRVP